MSLTRTSSCSYDEPSSHRASGHRQHDGIITNATAVDVGVLLEILENLLLGNALDLNAVRAIHGSLLRGDIISKPAHIEELTCQEELDQDVGLNLLQLLGNSRIGGPSDVDDGLDATRGANEEDGSPRYSDDAASDGPAVSIPTHMETVLATVDDWCFDAFKLDEVCQGHPLSTLAFYLFSRNGLIQKYDLEEVRLARFLRRIESGYPENPYHNRIHASDVLQGMQVQLTRGGLYAMLGEELALFAGYLAAVIHDYEHKGLNNDFLIRVNDELAMTYNDMSPMENHHVSSACRLMNERDYNFVRKLPREKRVRLRKLLIDMVLATDMKQHFSILSKFQAKLQIKLRSSSNLAPLFGTGNSLPHPREGGAATSSQIPITEDEQDRSLIMQVCLKVADVGHLSASWAVHHVWVSRLEEEFFRQGDREKALNLPVSPLMDRTRDGITKSQVGFFDIVALPLFYSWAAVFVDATPLVRSVEDNCNHWRALELARSIH